MTPPPSLPALLESRDPRIQVETDLSWTSFHTCDLCGLLECPGDVSVSWRSAIRGKGEQHACLNRSHVDGWITGLLLAELGDPDVHTEPVLVRIGGTL